MAAKSIRERSKTYRARKLDGGKAELRVYISKDTHDSLLTYCRETRQTKSDVTNQALQGMIGKR